MNIEALRKELTGLRAQIMDRVDRTHAHFHERSEALSPDFAEQIKQRENDEVIAALDAEGREELRLIEAALQRMDRGEYGVCEACGGLIAEARLQVIPYAENCVNCASTDSQGRS